MLDQQRFRFLMSDQPGIEEEQARDRTRSLQQQLRELREDQQLQQEREQAQHDAAVQRELLDGSEVPNPNWVAPPPRTQIRIDQYGHPYVQPAGTQNTIIDTTTGKPCITNGNVIVRCD